MVMPQKYEIHFEVWGTPVSTDRLLKNSRFNALVKQWAGNTSSIGKRALGQFAESESVRTHARRL
jgi:hypothetical protein